VYSGCSFSKAHPQERASQSGRQTYVTDSEEQLQFAVGLELALAALARVPCLMLPPVTTQDKQ